MSQEWMQLARRLEIIEEKHGEKLDEILVQTTKTNGRVSSVEKVVNQHDTVILEHSKVLNQNAGRDKVIWIVIGAISAVVGAAIGAFVGSLFK